MRDTVTIQLQDPDELSVEDAYRSLPRTGEILVVTPLSRLAVQLEMLENSGFAGMRIKAFSSASESITVRALKGKQGTCYNTGRVARYLGAARAALDDDHHLLIAGAEMPVCEKTSILYSMSSYNDLIQCSEADKDLLDMFYMDPELFEGDSFDVSQEKLYSMVRGEKQAVEYIDLFYPGPFKLLVLKDGTMVHRGKVNKVPAGEQKKITKGDGLYRIDQEAAGPHESYAEKYHAEGPMCLLKKSQNQEINLHDHGPDLSALHQISRDLLNRMLSVIEGGKDYFILTGSNREDEFGCCPSDEVTMADILVRAGILSASREPAATDSCPVTIYAFRNEITSMTGNLQFIQDDSFRKELLSRLKNTHVKNLRLATRWALLVFVALTIILAIIRVSGPVVTDTGPALYDRLDVSWPDGTVVVLFRYSQRCEQCRAMERYAKEVMQDKFPALIQNEQIEFRQLVMDLPQNRSLIDRFELVTSTVVIIRFEGKLEKDIRVLGRSWSLYDNELKFKEMLTDELNQITRNGV